MENFLFLINIVPNFVTSAPVPAVVGITKVGIFLFLKVSFFQLSFYIFLIKENTT